MPIYGNMFKSYNKLQKSNNEYNHMEAYIEAKFLPFYNDDYFDESVVLQEIKGSEARNEELKKIIDGMNKSLIFFMKRLDIVAKGIDDVMKLAESINKSNCNDKINSINKRLHSLDDRLKELEDEYIPTGAIHKLKGICSKFSVKYGDISLEEKKAFEKKITKYNDTLNDYYKRFGSQSSNLNQRIQKVCSKVEEYTTTQNADGLYKTIINWASYIIEETYNTSYDINYIISTFNIRKIENSIIYKILHKIKK